jgi:hypothetical protein
MGKAYFLGGIWSMWMSKTPTLENDGILSVEIGSHLHLPELQPEMGTSVFLAGYQKQVKPAY